MILVLLGNLRHWRSSSLEALLLRRLGIVELLAWESGWLLLHLLLRLEASLLGLHGVPSEVWLQRSLLSKAGRIGIHEALLLSLLLALLVWKRVELLRTARATTLAPQVGVRS